MESANRQSNCEDQVVISCVIRPLLKDDDGLPRSPEDLFETSLSATFNGKFPPLAKDDPSLLTEGLKLRYGRGTERFLSMAKYKVRIPSFKPS